MRKLYSVLTVLFVLFACSKDDLTPTEPLPVQVPKYTVTIDAGDGGTVSTAGGTYNKDSEVSVTATPNSEYLFESWSDGSTDNPRTIKVGADLTITANFVKKQYDLSVNVVGEGAVTEEVVIQGGRYNSDSQIKLTATAADGWEFTSWTGAIESSDNPVILTLDEAKEVTATFTRKKFDLAVTVVGEGSVTEEVVVQPGQYDYQTQVKLTAVPETGWEFSAWTGDLESTENPVTVTVEEAQNIIATFTRKKYDLTVTVEGQGAVTEEIVVQPGQYDYETQVKLTAVPAEGWEFLKWSGAVNSEDNPIVIEMEGPIQITAYFAIKAPGASTLSLPENEEDCEVGEGDNVNTATVSFSWSPSTNTSSYDLLVTNTTTNEIFVNNNLTETSTFLELERGETYSWKVTSRNLSSITTDSPTWRFTLPGLPGISDLILPENNKNCEVGEVNGNLAEVSFSWEAAENSILYDIILTNQATGDVKTYSDIEGTETTLELERAQTYSWKVVPKSCAISNTNGETWQFYLAGEAKQNSAPLPATALSPTPGSAVSPTDGKVIIRWEASDPDEDALTFSLIISTSEVFEEGDATRTYTGLSGASQEVEVTEGIYYWKVITSDDTISVTSDVFSFRVR